MSGGLYNREGTGRYLAGDSNPSEFDWNDKLVNSEYLTLLKRNGKIRKACSWVSREAIRPRFVMKKEQSMKGTKFNLPHTFDSVLEYLEWIGFFTELEKCYTWARCFGTAITIMFKEGEGKKAKYDPLPLYDSLQAFYPVANENGYTVVKEGLDSWYYKVQITDILGNTNTFNVHKDRVIVFNAPHLELRYEGNSEIEALAKIAIIQEQMFRSLMSRLHSMGAGLAVIRVKDETEKTIIDASIGDSLKYTTKIYTTEDPQMALQMYVPDLNSQQFREIWDIAQEEIANNMNMSKKLISGDPQGAISSAKYDTEISYTEVYQTQRHYKRATEHVLFMLGIKETTFEWLDPFPDDIEGTDNDNSNTVNTINKEGDKTNDGKPTKTDSGNSQSGAKGDRTNAKTESDESTD